MPRESRRGGKLPTQDDGENRRSDMTRARRRDRLRFCRRAHFIQRGLRVAQTPSVDPARLRPVCLPGFRPARRCRRLPLPPITPTSLTPDQAKRALETLSDDKKRAQVIETLRAIANASQQTQAAAPAPEPKSAIPLTADSLGAQLLLTVSEQVREISREVADVARTLTHYRAFYYWFVRTANDPSAYQQLLDIAWKLALVFICALPPSGWFSVSSSGRWRCWKRGFRKRRVPRCRRWPWPIRRLPRLTSPRRPRCSDGASVWRAPGSRWSGCPSCSGRLALELLPVLVFIGVATMLLGTEIGDLPTTRLVILAVVNAYALSRALICVVRALAGPFGLFRVRAETAAYIEIWARRIVTVAVVGHRLRQCGAAARPASRRLCRVAAPGDAGRASLRRRRHPAVPQAGGRCHSRAGRPHRRRGQGAQPRRRPLALSCDRARPRIVGGVGAQYPQRLRAAAAVFRRHHRGRTDRASRHHPGAEPDRSRFPHQPGSAAAAFRAWRPAPTAICRCCATSSRR